MNEADGATGRWADRMQAIVASVDRLNQWIAGLMEVAQKEPTATRPLDVLPTVRRVRDAVAPELAAKELSLEVNVPPSPLLCAHDPTTLEHALIAMTVNAVEASPLGGRIELWAEAVLRNGKPPACRISVLDSGPGLPADAPERIFEFSYSTKQQGMGLGLALARLALERQGGTAGAANRPEGGAIVFVELPLADEQHCPPSPQPPLSPSASPVRKADEERGREGEGEINANEDADAEDPDRRG